ncbi:MAG: YqgE/AlgH family protein [Bacteroidota bacterium]
MKKHIRLEDIGKIGNQRVPVAAGKLLVSEPFMFDQNFGRSVILLCEHTLEGTVGFILNKPTEVTVNDAIEDFPEFDGNLYYGGPVQTNSLHFIHTLGDKIPGSLEVVKGIYWGGDFEVLKLLIDTKQIRNDQVRFYAGYSGWEPNQLKKELKEKTWIIADVNSQYPFAEDPLHLWRDVLKGMDEQFSVMSNFPEDPSLN